MFWQDQYFDLRPTAYLKHLKFENILIEIVELLTTHLHPVFDQVQWLYKHSCTHTKTKIALSMKIVILQEILAP